MDNKSNKGKLDILTLEDKILLLEGKNFWETQDFVDKNIKSIFLADGPSGLRKQVLSADHLGLNPSINATCLPSSSTSACSWDVDVTKKIGKIISQEANDNNVSILLGPGVNIKRNPLCGRNFEYFSEDPYLTGKLSSSYIRGVQDNGVSACIKHFACNNQETRRMTSNSIIDIRALREIYLTAFEIAIKESKVESLMTSYNKVNGVYMNENKFLIDIIRNEYNYSGLIVSDWGGNNNKIDAIKAGSDLEMPTSHKSSYYEVIDGYNEKRIDESEINKSVNRIINIVNKEKTEIKDRINDPHEEAVNIAQECMVLLKNEDSILPLKRKSKVAIVGDFAFKCRYQGAGSSQVNPNCVEEIIDIIKDYDLDVVGFEKGFHRHGKKSDRLISKACRLAEKADYVLCFVGLDEFSEAEGIDRKNMFLPSNQINLINKISLFNQNLIIIVQGGSPIEMAFSKDCKALLLSYLAGEGTSRAILNILTNVVSPSGKLAETIPVSYLDVPNYSKYGLNEDDVPYLESIYVGYRYYSTNNINVMYPFGYGLTYSKFKYSNLNITKDGVSFEIENIGSYDAKEIAQLYIGKKESQIYRSKIELKGFTKIFIKKGETKKIFIPFDEYTFRYFNIKTNSFEIEDGEYQIYIGESSDSLLLNGEITIKGTTNINPYDSTSIPNYFSGCINNISLEEFGKIDNSLKIPTKLNNKKKKIIVNQNTPIYDLRYAKGFTAKLFSHAIGFAIKFLKLFRQRSLVNTLIMGVYYSPIRVLVKMAGVINMKQLNGLIEMFNGHFFKGFIHFLRKGEKKKNEK